MLTVGNAHQAHEELIARGVTVTTPLTTERGAVTSASTTRTGFRCISSSRPAVLTQSAAPKPRRAVAYRRPVAVSPSPG